MKRAAERLSVIAPKDTPQTKTATSSDRRNRALYADEDPTEALSFARARDLVAGLDKRIREADEQVRQVTISCARSYQAIQGIRAGGCALCGFASARASIGFGGNGTQRQTRVG